MIEILRADYVNEASERIERNDERYRFVLDLAGGNLKWSIDQDYHKCRFTSTYCRLLLFLSLCKISLRVSLTFSFFFFFGPNKAYKSSLDMKRINIANHQIHVYKIFVGCLVVRFMPHNLNYCSLQYFLL